MKTVSKVFAVLALIALSFTPRLVQAQDAPPPPPPEAYSAQGQGGGDDQGASFQQFYDQLGDQGQWVQTDDYGYVFQPNVSDPSWAPYTDGHWVNSDAGWVWVSDEPWGWATYHYGRWANIDGTGWVWVPGYRWAPAWVSWRYGGGYCGWAPLPPETFIGAEYGDPGVDVGIGFHFGGDVDVSFNIGPGCYNFVRVDDFGERNYRGHYLDRGRNFTVINNTTNITNINVNKTNNGTINNFHGVNVGGPQLNEINAHSKNRVQTVQLAQAGQPGRSTLQGNTLNVYAPHVNAASAKEARPARVARTIDRPAFNHGDSINKPLDVTSSIRGTAPSAEAIQAAKTAEAHVPAKAKIATEKTVARTSLNKPLTTMQPVGQAHSATGAGAFNQSAQHSTTANSPYTGTPEKKAIQHQGAVNSSYTGEAATHEAQQKQFENPQGNASQGQTQAEINQQARAAQQQKLQAQHQANLEKARETQQERAASSQQQHTSNQQEDRTPPQQHSAAQQQQQVQHAPVQQQVQHAPVQQREQAAPRQQAAPAQGNGNKQNEGNGPGQGGPGNH